MLVDTASNARRQVLSQIAISELSYEDDEYLHHYCIDSDGNLIHSEGTYFLTPGLCQLEVAVDDDGMSLPFILDDDGMPVSEIHMTLKNDELFVTCIGQGNTGGAKRIKLL